MVLQTTATGDRASGRVCNNLFCVILNVENDGCISFQIVHVGEQLVVAWPRGVLVLIEILRAHDVN